MEVNLAQKDTECEENNIIYFVLSALGFIQFTPLKALLTLAMDRQTSKDVVASMEDNKDSFPAPGIDSIHCTKRDTDPIVRSSP